MSGEIKNFPIEWSWRMLAYDKIPDEYTLIWQFLVIQGCHRSEKPGKGREKYKSLEL